MIWVIARNISGLIPLSDPVEVDRSDLKTALTLEVLQLHRSESSELLEGPEYCYPEVEPRFDADEIAALFEIGRASCRERV